MVSGTVARRRELLRAALAAVVFAVLCDAALAEDYPVRPITLIVPYPAGGGNDIIARTVAEKMSASLHQQIVIENRGGAGGTVATRQVARSAPDGYTLLIATSSLAINPSLYVNVGYDPRKDFSPVGLIAQSGNVVVAHPSVAAKSITDLIALAKSEAGKLTFASTGTGSSVHLAAELFAAMAGVTLTAIPYKGSGPALADLLGGHVAVMFSPMTGAVSLVRDGKLRALAVTGPRRSTLFPEVPTVAESGLPGYEAVLHYGIVAPAGTPTLVIAKLNAALRAALDTDEVKSRLAIDGAETLPSSPEGYAADIDREHKRWSEIIAKAGIQPQ